VSLSSVANTTVTATTVVKGRSGGGQVAMQDVRTTSANANMQQTAQRIATTSLVSAGQTSVGAAGSQKGNLVGVTMATATSGSKTPTAVQMQYYRQQQVLLRQQQLKVLQAQAGSGQKVSVAVSVTAAAAVAAQQRAATTTLMKQGIASVGTAGAVTGQTAVGKPTMTRTMSDTEMAALLKRQALQQQAKAAAAAAAVAQVQVSVLTKKQN